MPCASRDFTSEVFQITFADGHSVAKPLDTRNTDPIVPKGCDRSTRDAVAYIGDELLERYFR